MRTGCRSAIGGYVYSEVFDLKPTSSLELESIDRLYLNGYVPQLQHGAGLVGFLAGGLIGD
jgi:hypothetical protein